MTLEVVWAERALQRLDAILVHVAAYRPRAAVALIDRLFDRAAGLGEFPESGRAYTDLPGAGLREVVEGNYRLIYRVDPHRERLVVVAVRHVREAGPVSG
jgi:plasmid stabilization system protein ParE